MKLDRREFPWSGRWRTLRSLLIASIILLSAQGWFGDFVNIFQAPANGAPAPSLSIAGITAAVASLAPAFFLMVHAYLGLALFVLAVVIVSLAFAWPAGTGVRIWAVLALASIISAAYGGFSFVRTGFADGGGSAQMGGSFIAAYGCWFMTLYYTRPLASRAPAPTH